MPNQVRPTATAQGNPAEKLIKVFDTKEESEAGGAIRFTISVPQTFQLGRGGSDALLSNLRSASASALASVSALLPEPPPLVIASQEAVVDGYSFTVTSPVTSVHATSTRVDRTAPRAVPAYTLAVEPKQVIEVLTKP